MRPNHYTHADVVKLARTIAPHAWEKFDAEPGNKSYYEEKYWGDEGYILSKVRLTTNQSMVIAGMVLAAHYRDCSHDQGLVL